MTESVIQKSAKISGAIMTPNDAKTQAVILVDSVSPGKHNLGHKIKVFWRCYQQQIIWVILFYLLQVFLFGMGVYEYLYVSLPAKPKLHYSAGSMVGIGFGMVLQVNCGILLVGPALRWMTGSLRKTWVARFVPFDSWIGFHVVVATTTFVAVVGHIVAMVVSFYMSSQREETKRFGLTLSMMLSRSGIVGSDFLGFTSISGWVALACISVMAIFALPPVRRSLLYDLFYWTHKLQFVFWAALIVHTPDFWKFFIIPFFLYLMEKSRKYVNAVRWSRTSHITEVKVLPAEVTNLVIKRPHGFNYTPGDYCFLKIPGLGIFSWHPFTISSNPELTESIWFHIKSSGDYTKRLRRKFEMQLQSKTATGEKNQTNILMVDPLNEVHDLRSYPTTSSQSFVTDLDVPVLIDGPYGSSSNGLLFSDHAVLICAGIGITPFASVLSSLLSEYKRRSHSHCPNCDHEFPSFISANPMRIDGRRLKLRKVDLVWVIREPESIDWFYDLFHAWETHQNAYGEKSPIFLNCHIYITNTTSKQKQNKNAVQCRWKTGSSSRTVSVKAGRPNWPSVFEDLEQEKHGKVDVFYCGPHMLENQIRRLCGQHNFRFSWENF